MSKREQQLNRLIHTYEAMAAFQDAQADDVVAKAEREGWHDDLTQAESTFRHQARTSRYLAQEVRDGMTN